MYEYNINLDRNVVLIRCRFKTNSMTMINTMLCDTGATYTSLSKKSLTWLGYDLTRPNRWVKICTANGELTVPLFILPRFGLFDFLLDNIEVIALDMTGAYAGAGLLGLGVLRRFDDVCIDFGKSKIKFEPKK